MGLIGAHLAEIVYSWHRHEPQQRFACSCGCHHDCNLYPSQADRPFPDRSDGLRSSVFGLLSTHRCLCTRWWLRVWLPYRLLLLRYLNSCSCTCACPSSESLGRPRVYLREFAPIRSNLGARLRPLPLRSRLHHFLYRNHPIARVVSGCSLQRDLDIVT